MALMGCISLISATIVPPDRIKFVVFHLHFTNSITTVVKVPQCYHHLRHYSNIPQWNLEIITRYLPSMWADYLIILITLC